MKIDLSPLKVNYKFLSSSESELINFISKILFGYLSDFNSKGYIVSSMNKLISSNESYTKAIIIIGCTSNEINIPYGSFVKEYFTRNVFSSA